LHVVPGLLQLLTFLYSWLTFFHVGKMQQFTIINSLYISDEHTHLLVLGSFIVYVHTLACMTLVEHTDTLVNNHLQFSAVETSFRLSSFSQASFLLSLPSNRN